MTRNCPYLSLGVRQFGEALDENPLDQIGKRHQGGGRHKRVLSDDKDADQKGKCPGRKSEILSRLSEYISVAGVAVTSPLMVRLWCGYLCLSVHPVACLIERLAGTGEK